MSIPLSNVGIEPGGTGEDRKPLSTLSWRRFLSRREDLTARMELSVCNGCDQCGGRCLDGFKVTREEYEAVHAFFATLPQSEQDRLLAQSRTLPWPGAEDTGATVTYCRYRDQENGRCSVYLARPTICRLFGQTHWLPCPIEAISQYPDDAADVWNEYRRLLRRTFEEWDKISAEEKENGTVARND